MAEKMLFPEWFVFRTTIESDPEGKLGVAFEVLSDNGEDCPPVCCLYDHMGSHLESFDDAERNALMIAAAPRLCQELLHMVKMFNGPSASMSKAHQQAVKDAFEAIRLVNGDDSDADKDMAADLAVRGKLN